MKSKIGVIVGVRIIHKCLYMTTAILNLCAVSTQQLMHGLQWLLHVVGLGNGVRNFVVFGCGSLGNESSGASQFSQRLDGLAQLTANDIGFVGNGNVLFPTNKTMLAPYAT